MSAMLLPMLLVLIAAFAMAAAAVRTVNRYVIRQWSTTRKGSPHAVETLRRTWTDTADAVLILAVSLWTAISAVADAKRAMAISLPAIIGSLALVAGGVLVPSAIGRRWATRLAPFAMQLLSAASSVLAPVRWLVRMPRVTSAPAFMGEHGASEGLSDLLRDNPFENTEAQDEMAILSGVIEFGRTMVAEVMTRREDIFALPLAMPPHEAALRIAQAAFSRVPVFDTSVDDIRGMVLAFDVFRLAGDHMPPIRPVAKTVPERAANELLFDMLRARQHMALVYDGAGRVLGLVTLEDLLEELVGEIRDEHDEPEQLVPRGARP